MKYKITFLALLTASVLSAEPANTVSIAGRTYRDIYGVSLTPSGDISIITGRSTLTFKPPEVPSEFLESWGITKDHLSDNAKRAEAAIIAEKEKKAEEDRKKNAIKQKEERKAFIQNHTRIYYALQFLDGGILANPAIYSTLASSMASQGGGGYSVRVPRRGPDIVFLVGYSEPNLTESSIISAAFVPDGTFTFTDTDRAKRVIPKLKYIKEE
jgi:hypothetical protein